MTRCVPGLSCLHGAPHSGLPSAGAGAGATTAGGAAAAAASAEEAGSALAARCFNCLKIGDIARNSCFEWETTWRNHGIAWDSPILRQIHMGKRNKVLYCGYYMILPSNSSWRGDSQHVEGTRCHQCHHLSSIGKPFTNDTRMPPQKGIFMHLQLIWYVMLNIYNYNGFLLCFSVAMFAISLHLHGLTHSPRYRGANVCR